MAKAIGLIGNFKGKVGNMVGYQIPDSNTGNTQGIRIYQPVVKNPKTSAQAEQRAKLAPINATYRALKSIIDRGNEGLPYGNKSRLAWLKGAFSSENMPWIEKGKPVTYAVLCPITKGSLASLLYSADDDHITFAADGVQTTTPVNTVGAVSTILKAANPALKEGDQVTIALGFNYGGNMCFTVFSFVIDSTSAVAISGFTADEDKLQYGVDAGASYVAAIVSREGDNGQHLRSNESLLATFNVADTRPYRDEDKTKAIESYMSNAAVNSDWAEESIQ